MIDTAYLWLAHARYLKCDFDVMETAAKAVKFSVDLGARSFVLPVDLEALPRWSKTHLALQKILETRPWEPAEFRLSEYGNSTSVTVFWKNQPIGRLPAPHVPWMMPLFPTGRMKCFVRAIEQGSRGKERFTMSIVLTGIGEALQAYAYNRIAAGTANGRRPPAASIAEEPGRYGANIAVERKPSGLPASLSVTGYGLSRQGVSMVPTSLGRDFPFEPALLHLDRQLDRIHPCGLSLQTGPPG